MSVIIKYVPKLAASFAGPDTFTRCLAARQLAYLIRQLPYKQLSKAVSLVLPCVIAAVKDQSPSVQVYGLQALQYIATGSKCSALTCCCCCCCCCHRCHRKLKPMCLHMTEYFNSLHTKCSALSEADNHIECLMLQDILIPKLCPCMRYKLACTLCLVIVAF